MYQIYESTLLAFRLRRDTDICINVRDISTTIFIVITNLNHHHRESISLKRILIIDTKRQHDERKDRQTDSEKVITRNRLLQLRKKIVKITACPFLAILFGKFGSCCILGLPQFGVVKVWGRQSLGASNFVGVKV